MVRAAEAREARVRASIACADLCCCAGCSSLSHFSSAMSSSSLSLSSSVMDSLSSDLSSMELDPSLSLSHHYRTLHRQYLSLRSSSSPSSSSPSSTDPSRILPLLSRLLSLHTLVTSANLYSGNEQLSDLSTPSLKYLLLPYHCAELLLSMPGIERRLVYVQQALALLSSFLHQTMAVGVMDAQEQVMYKRLVKQHSSKTGSSSSSSSGSGSGAASGAGGARIDPSVQRAEKIAKFKKEKELEEKLAVLDKRREVRRGKRAGSGEAEEEEDADEDEESEREYTLLALHQAISKSLDHIHYSMQELEFLQMRAKQQEAAGPGAGGGQQQQQQRLQQQQQSGGGHKPNVYTIRSAADLSKPIPASMAQYLQPVPGAAAAQQSAAVSAAHATAAAINAQQGGGGGAGGAAGSASARTVGSLATSLQSQLDTRANARAAVFRDSNPATIGIEEWAEQQIRDGHMPGPAPPVSRAMDPEARKRYIERRSAEMVAEEMGGGGAGEDEVEHELGGERGMEAAEAKQAKDRHWDNWKDAHEKGAGNKMK